MAAASITSAPGALLPAPELDMRRAARIGVVFGVAAAFVGAVGMVSAFSERAIVSWLTLSYVVLALLGFGSGYIASKPPPQIEGYEASKPGVLNVVAGAMAGAITGAIVWVFVVIVDVTDVRDIFVEFTPELVDILTFGKGVGLGALLLLAAGLGFGVAGGLTHLIPRRGRTALFVAVGATLIIGLLQVLTQQIVRGVNLDSVADLIFQGSSAGLEPTAAPLLAAFIFALTYAVKRPRKTTVRERYEKLQGRQRTTAVLVVLLIVVMVLGALPQVLGNFLSSALDLAGTFLLMALGLNIVIGFAGLLDLGYVAFFAVGAYATAVLTSPSSPAFAPQLTFWEAIPFIMLVAAIAGLMVGTPVLRMRGDYLAIVTLGFGEIARLIAQSEWQEETLGGAQGIARIPAISIGPVDFVGSEEFFYLIFGFVLVFAYITYALQRSRMGRAWNAMREDEAVAEAMGVNIVAAKLTAFALGAVMASLGGALFAHRVTTVFPHSFDIEVSIVVVVLVIVGGMGSVPGVMLSAFVLIALPELLREFSEFRFLLYGMLLIYMMLRRPEGLIPSRARQRELREEERAQDAWLRAETQRQQEEEAAPTEGS